MESLEAVLGSLAQAKHVPAEKHPVQTNRGHNARTLLFLTACLTAGCLMLALISQTGCSGGRGGGGGGGGLVGCHRASEGGCGGLSGGDSTRR